MNFKDLFRLNIAFINVGGYLKYYLKLLKHPNLISKSKRNIGLLEKKRHDICYICGLGPSLKNVDLTKIEGDTIVVNRFYKMASEYPNFIPTYYLMIDAAFVDISTRLDTIGALDEYIEKGCTYLLNPLAKNIDSLSKYATNNIFYTPCCKGIFSENRKLQIDQILPAFGNVVCTAIGIAMAMKYNKIVLLGCDFNSFAQATPAHCYKDKNTLRQIPLDYELFCYSFNANIHMELAKYASKHGISIINSTKGSLIDAYPIEIDMTLYKNS